MPRPTRRDFSQTVLGLSAGATVLTSLTGTAVAQADKIRVAVMGVRGRGSRLLSVFAAQKDVEITHVIDIQESVLAAKLKTVADITGKTPVGVRDYRKVLEDKSVEALVIGTPDHWHALPTIHACQAGKDVYVEKPDGHNINEGKAMVAAARKYDRMVQMGTQARSSPYLHEAREYIKSGAIGKVIFGRAWETDKQRAIPRVADGTPPADIDYDMWLGPAPLRPFNSSRFHGNWRWFFDYGCGDLGNDGVHRMDYCRWMMGIDTLPQTVSSEGGKFFFDDAQEWPDTQMVSFGWPGKMLVYEMRIWSGPKLFNVTEGAAIHGDSGWVLCTNSNWTAFDSAGKVVKQGGDNTAEVTHIRNFLEAVRNRKRTHLNQEIEQGHVSSVMCHAGNIAWRVGKRLTLDAKTETFHDVDADKLVGRTYRKGYELPDPV